MPADSDQQITQAQHDDIAQMREAYLQSMGDTLPFFRDLYELGAIDGWRAVLWVRPLPSDLEGPPSDK